jgi:hypothetical protein
VNDLIPKPEDEEVDKEMNDDIIQCLFLEFGLDFGCGIIGSTYRLLVFGICLL